MHLKSVVFFPQLGLRQIVETDPFNFLLIVRMCLLILSLLSSVILHIHSNGEAIEDGGHFEVKMEVVLQ